MIQKIALFFFVGLRLSVAQDFSRLDTLIQRMEQHQKVMGSVAVSNAGKTVYNRSLGTTDLKTPIDANTLFRIGSISKTFTAALVLKAVEEQKLHLEQKLSEFYPEVLHSEQITLSHLLSHRSGIANFTETPTYTQWYTRPQTRGELLKIILNGGSKFTPGSQEGYSNSNYVVLSLLLEKIYAEPFDKILEKQILSPLGLKFTRYGSKIQTEKNEALSYAYMGNWILYQETDLSIPLGAGGIISTPNDLNKFTEALFSGKIIQDKSLEIMKAGHGLVPMTWQNHKGYGHSGGIDAFSAFLLYFPEEKISLAFTTNGLRIPMNTLTAAVRDAAFGQEVKLQDFAPVEVPEAVLETYIGTYSGPELPLKLNIARSGQKLYFQATGQFPVLLEALSQDSFQFLPSRMRVDFKENTLIFRQGGKTYTLSKE